MAMKRDERLGEILALLVRDGRIDVEDAAGTLGVSLATLRRDLDHLSGKQLLTRTHGGALPNGTSYELPLRYRSGRTDQKRRIGEAAAARIEHGAVVSLNGGTTCAEVARALGARPDLVAAPGQPSITVVTNAVNIAAELAIRSHIKLVLSGGVCRPQSYELVGPLAEPVLSSLTLDYAILGVDGLRVDGANGSGGASGGSGGGSGGAGGGGAGGAVFARNEGEASINRLMATRAERVIVVADSAKIGERAFAQICPLDEIDELVTDTDLAADALAALQAAGLTVHQA